MGKTRMTTLAPELNLPPEHPLRQILDTIAAHPELREPVLRVLLTERLLALPEQVDTLTGQVDALQGSFEEFREETREQFREVNERIDEANRSMQEQFREVNKRIDENSGALVETNRLLSENTASTKRLEGHVGRLRGISYEDSCRYYIGVILDGYLHSPVLADRELINNRLRKARRDELISRQEYEHGLSPDIIARAEDDESHTQRLAVVEASVTFNQRDLENAATRAAIIAKVTGVRTDAFVATHYEWPDDVGAAAEQLGVTIIRRESEEHAYDY